MKTKENVINCNQRVTYLVKFQFSGNQHYIVQNDGLMDVLKAHEKPLEFIKKFDFEKQKFVRVSKSEILANYSWETEIFLYIEKHPYFT